LASGIDNCGSVNGYATIDIQDVGAHAQPPLGIVDNADVVINGVVSSEVEVDAWRRRAEFNAPFDCG
jgi:hypothetical protein